VTAESARKSRQAVRRLKKTEPDALIAVCGCLSQLDPGMAASLGADLIGGSGDRQGFALEIESLMKQVRGPVRGSEIGLGLTSAPPDFPDGSGQTNAPPDSLRGPEESPPVLIIDDPKERSVFEQLPLGVSTERTRALLKIQDGCENYCAYCVIPSARGRVRSLPLRDAGSCAKSLEQQGFREIVITGIEISAYGKDFSDGTTLTDAVSTISAEAPGVRLRLGSLDPGMITEDFCNSMGGIPNLCDHFHISLQSGCDETLRQMGRKYKAGDVLRSIQSLRSKFPNCGITADLIAGFPGESEAEFAQTLDFIKAAAFSGMHIFPYSPRPGTAAANMAGQIKKSIRHERARAALAAAELMARDFMLSQTGKTLEVLFECERGGVWTGHSSNYLEVSVRSGGSKNSVKPVRITGLEDGALCGRIID